MNDQFIWWIKGIQEQVEIVRKAAATVKEQVDAVTPIPLDCADVINGLSKHLDLSVAMLELADDVIHKFVKSGTT